MPNPIQSRRRGRSRGRAETRNATTSEQQAGSNRVQEARRADRRHDHPIAARKNKSQCRSADGSPSQATSQLPYLGTMYEPVDHAAPLSRCRSVWGCRAYRSYPVAWPRCRGSTSRAPSTFLRRSRTATRPQTDAAAAPLKLRRSCSRGVGRGRAHTEPSKVQARPTSATLTAGLNIVRRAQKNVSITSVTRCSASATRIRRHLSKVRQGCEMSKAITSPTARSSPGAIAR